MLFRRLLLLPYICMYVRTYIHISSYMIDDVGPLRGCLPIVNVDLSWEDDRIISSFAYEKIVINKFRLYYLYNTICSYFKFTLHSVIFIEQCISVVTTIKYIRKLYVFRN